MTAKANRKGKTYERELAQVFRAAMPGCEAKRGLSQTRGGAAECADVELEHFTVEAKHRKAPNVRAALEEAIRSEQPGKWPIAVCKWNRRKGEKAGLETVTMRLEDFLELASVWWLEVGRDTVCGDIEVPPYKPGDGIDLDRFEASERVKSDQVYALRVRPDGSLARADAASATFGGKR